MHQSYQQTTEHLPPNVERYLEELFRKPKIVYSGYNRSNAEVVEDTIEQLPSDVDRFLVFYDEEEAIH